MASIKTLIEAANGGDIKLPLYALQAADIITSIAADPTTVGRSMDIRRAYDLSYVVGLICHVTAKTLNISLYHPLTGHLMDTVQKYGVEQFANREFTTIFLTEMSQFLGEFHELVKSRTQVPLNATYTKYVYV